MASPLFDLPTRAVWFKFSNRARFHDRPGFPSLRRWCTEDKRILDYALAASSLGVVTFYTRTEHPDPFDKTSPPYAQRFLEIRKPDANLGPDRFLPSWLGYARDQRIQSLRQSSILYINRFPE